MTASGFCIALSNCLWQAERSTKKFLASSDGSDSTAPAIEQIFNQLTLTRLTDSFGEAISGNAPQTTLFGIAQTLREK